MAATTDTLTILHRCNVAPAADEAEQRLPLTFFDIFCILMHPNERLFFYRHPCSAAEFTHNIVPQLKRSLSQTLRHYLPLAGNFYHPLVTGIMPELRYFSGDSVAVTFAESSEATHFDYLTGNHARETEAFHRLMPELPESKIDSEFKKLPLLAIQVTLFPETGIAIGVINHHVAGDESSMFRFLKAWSSITKLAGEGGKLSDNDITPPFYDRSIVKDPTKRAEILWNATRNLNLGASNPSGPTNKVRSTFILQKNKIEKLKLLVKQREPDLDTHLSSFTVSVAYFWWCIDRAAAETGEQIGDDDIEVFGLSVDARSRTEPPLPEEYFGNCIVIETVMSTHGEIKGENGIVEAAKAVGNMIKEKVNKKGMLLSDADKWLVKYIPMRGKRGFGVAGSPKFYVYGLDFGWGKPVKYEMVSLDRDSGIISLCKARDLEGALEMGVSLPKKTMDAFAFLLLFLWFHHGGSYYACMGIDNMIQCLLEAYVFHSSVSD